MIDDCRSYVLLRDGGLEHLGQRGGSKLSNLTSTGLENGEGLLEEGREFLLGKSMITLSEEDHGLADSREVGAEGFRFNVVGLDVLESVDEGEEKLLHVELSTSGREEGGLTKIRR